MISDDYMDFRGGLLSKSGGPLVAIDVPHGSFFFAVERRIGSRTCQLHHLICIKQTGDRRHMKDRAAVMLEDQGRTVSLKGFPEIRFNLG